MERKVLVTYATWAGSAADIAESIGTTLRGQGIPVDVLSVEQVKCMDDYRFVILGSAIHAGKFHPKMVKFIKKNAKSLSQIPFAIFVVCLTMKDNCKENRRTVIGYVQSLLDGFKGMTPLDIGLFAGVVDYHKLAWTYRLLLKAKKEVEADYRDWDAIRVWVEDLILYMMG